MNRVAAAGAGGVAAAAGAVAVAAVVAQHVGVPEAAQAWAARKKEELKTAAMASAVDPALHFVLGKAGDWLRVQVAGSPYMPACLSRRLVGGFDAVWPEAVAEIRHAVHVGVRRAEDSEGDYDGDAGVDSDTDPGTPRLTEAPHCRWWSVRGGCCSLRAFVLHHWAPHDRDFWLALRTDPVFVLFQLLCLCPVFGLRAGPL